MRRAIEGEVKDKKIDEILEKHKKLDDICVEIFFTLMAYKRLRFNELHRMLKQFNVDISKPVLIDHLKHLKKQKLISRKVEGFQNVSYGLTDEVNSLLDLPEEWVKESPLGQLLENLIEGKDLTRNMPKKVRQFVKALKPLDLNNMTEEELDLRATNELITVLTQNLFELKTHINYDLKLDKPERNAVFWNLFRNPIYRMLERGIVYDCRSSEKYKKNLFKKIDLLISELKSDRGLFREISKKSLEK